MQPVRRARATGCLLLNFAKVSLALCRRPRTLLSLLPDRTYIMIIMHAAEILTSFRQRVFAGGGDGQKTKKNHHRRRHYSCITVAGV
jgi:hypothetical protein